MPRPSGIAPTSIQTCAASPDVTIPALTRDDEQVDRERAALGGAVRGSDRRDAGSRRRVLRAWCSDQAGESLVPAYATRAVHDVLTAAPVRFGEGLSGWVAANRHTIVNSHADLDLGDAAHAARIDGLHEHAGVRAG